MRNQVLCQIYWQAIRKRWFYSMAGDNELPLISQGIKTSAPISFPRELCRSCSEGLSWLVAENNDVILSIVSVLFGVRVRHHWWLLFRAAATWPSQGFDPVGLALKVTVLPDQAKKSSEDQIARATWRRHATHLTLCVTAFLASCDFQACALCSLYDTCEKYQIPCWLKSTPILVVSLVTWSPNWGLATISACVVDITGYD